MPKTVRTDAHGLLVCGLMVAVLAFAATGCASKVSESPGKLAGLGPEARKIVERVQTQHDLEEVCAGGKEAVKKAVRGATMRLMIAGSVTEPRESGTAAGHHIAARCREINPDY